MGGKSKKIGATFQVLKCSIVGVAERQQSK